MCGHGTIGVVRTLEHLGRITPGDGAARHAGRAPVGAELAVDGLVTIENVPGALPRAGRRRGRSGGRARRRRRRLRRQLVLPRPSLPGEAVEPGNRERLRDGHARDPAGARRAGRHGRRRGGSWITSSFGPAGAARRGQPKLRHVPRRRLRPLALRHRDVGEDGGPARPRRARRSGRRYRQESITGSLFTGWLEQRDGRSRPADPGPRLRHRTDDALLRSPRPFRARLASGGADAGA